MAVEVTSLVWQLVEATAQLIKLKKFVTSLVFEKDSAIVCVFYEKQRLNKTGTSQVGAISKAQKAQNIFFGKKLEISEKKFFRKMSHSAEKYKRGTLFDL